MPKWITTSCHTVRYGYEINKETGGWFSNGMSLTFSTPFDDLQKNLSEIMTWCDNNQLTIKSVIPLTTSVAHYNHETETRKDGGAGYGYGYGVSQNTGFTVFVQKEEDISEEEYARRSKHLQLKPLYEALLDKVANLEKCVAKDATITTDIISKKMMFGGQWLCLGDQKYKVEEEAWAAQAKVREQIAANSNALKEAQTELSNVQRALEDLG